MHDRRFLCTIVTGWILFASPFASAQGEAASGASSDVVEEVVVTAFRRDYLRSDASVGLGLEADVLETPLSLMVIPEDLLQDQQVNNVEDALRNVAAVTRFKQGNGGEEKFSIRGFDASQSLYKDGSRLNNRFNATNIATTETANIARYEILKGPASILYGQGEPGGVINYVTKKPEFEPLYSVELIGGSDRYRRIETDATGPLNDRFAYRLVGAFEDSESFRDELARRRVLLNPSARVELGEDARIDATYEYIKDDYTQDRGQALEPLSDGSFRYSDQLSPSDFLGIPGWNDRTRSEYRRFGLTYEQSWGELYALEISGSHTRVDKELFDSSPRTQNAAGLFPISPLYQEGEGEQTYIQVNNRFVFGDARRVQHKVLAAFHGESIENDGLSFDVVASEPIFFDPVSGSSTPATLAIDPVDPFPIATDEREYGVVLQDLVSIGQRHFVLVGASYRDFENREDDFDANEMSPRIGYLFQPHDGIALYASYARGFVPTGATDENDEVLNPETTEQLEAGAKLELADGLLLFTAALFEISKKDVAYTDPASLVLPPEEQWSDSLGETRTRGGEVQVIGEITPSWRVIGGYSYLDNELVEGDPETGTTGNRLPGIPRHSGSLWTVYEISDGPLAGLGFGAGIFSQSEVYIGLENLSEYSGWAQLDAMAFYKRARWKAQVNVRNLFDREYYLTQAVASENLASVRVGTSSPFAIIASLAYEL